MAQSQRILLVDDDPQISWGVGKYLTRQGFKIVSCGDGAEAIEFLEEKEIDILVTDIQMPRVNGLALVEWVSQHCPNVRVVAITAFGCDSIRDILREKGAISYLEKPFDPKILLDLIKPTPQNATFSGSVDSIDLLDYVQLIFVTRRNVFLKIRASNGKVGSIYIKGGTACHAECGDLTGREAFYECMGFNGGSFVTQPWEEPPEITIDVRGEFLLMDAARTKDESGHVCVSSRMPGAPEKTETCFNECMDSLFPPPIINEVEK